MSRPVDAGPEPRDLYCPHGLPLDERCERCERDDTLRAYITFMTRGNAGAIERPRLVHRYGRYHVDWDDGSVACPHWWRTREQAWAEIVRANLHEKQRQRYEEDANHGRSR